MKIHDEVDDWIAAALCGALTQDEQRNFEQHLADCPHCRSQYEETQKMSDILKQTLPELRPDPAFEQRVIAGFREKTSKGWSNPLRGLVWLLRFRTAQAAFAVLLVAAMIEAGTLITGERAGGGKTKVSQATKVVNVEKFPDMKVTAQTVGGLALTNTGSSSPVFNGGVTDTHTIAGDFRINSGASVASSGSMVMNVGATQVPIAQDVTYTGQVYSGKLGGNGATSQWTTGANWGDTTAADIQSAGDTATFNELENQRLAIASGTVDVLQNRVVTASDASFGALHTGATTTFAGNITGSNSLGANATTNSLIFGSAGSGAMVKSGTGTLVLTGSNTYSGATTISSGTLQLNSNSALGAGAADSSYTRVTVANSKSYDHNGITVTGGATTMNANDMVEKYRIAKNLSGTVSDSGQALTVSGIHTLTPTVTDGAAFPAKNNQNNLTLALNSGTASIARQAPQFAPPAPLPIIDTRKLIRSATIDFEVPNFDRALSTITAVATENQGYIFTQNSQKDTNGKLQGEIVVKVLPPNLDRFLLMLRSVGDIKNQTVSAQDVSKDYYDTEARIRNKEITEQRMIDLLKKRTGDVSDLLEVEKQIAEVRGEVEQMQGSLKYLDGQVQFATVRITLQEKDPDQTAAYLLTEQAQLSLFAKDVEQAFTEAKGDAQAAKAQTLESHIERDADGREVATLHLLLPPESSEEAIIKLKAIGRIQTFTSQTQRVARNGTVGGDAMKSDRDKVDLNLVIQHDIENAVQGTNVGIQTDQVEEKTTQIKQEAVAQGIEVKGAEFNRAQSGAEVSSMLLRMPLKKYPAFIEKIKNLGKVKDFTVTRREGATATEDAPAEIVLQIYNQGAPTPVVEDPTKPTVHNSITEVSSTLLWSLRMIGVTLAFVAPWLVIGGLVWFFATRRSRMAKK